MITRLTESSGRPGSAAQGLADAAWTATEREPGSPPRRCASKDSAPFAAPDDQQLAGRIDIAQPEPAGLPGPQPQAVGQGEDGPVGLPPVQRPRVVGEQHTPGAPGASGSTTTALRTKVTEHASGGWLTTAASRRPRREVAAADLISCHPGKRHPWPDGPANYCRSL